MLIFLCAKVFFKIHSEVFLKKKSIHLRYFPGKGIGRCESPSFLSPGPNPFHPNAFYMCEALTGFDLYWAALRKVVL